MLSDKQIQEIRSPFSIRLLVPEAARVRSYD
jgi:hypothetical protein